MICLFGGTFDPVHLGHVHAAASVCDALGISAIRMLLSARPGHRGLTGASVAQRWKMLELACADDPRLRPDDTEMRRAEQEGKPSYTVDTLEGIRAEAPDAVVVWVVGSDAFREMTSWHRWKDVLALANLLVLQRPGAPLELPEALQALLRTRRIRGVPEGPAGAIRLLDAPMLDVSATRVREALSAGNPAQIADLLPPAVYTYIKKYHLYGVVSDP